MITLNSEAATEGVLSKKMFLEFSKNSLENICARVSLLIKLPKACNFIKMETLAQVCPMNFAKFVRAPDTRNTSGRLLLPNVLDFITKVY